MMRRLILLLLPIILTSCDFVDKKLKEGHARYVSSFMWRQERQVPVVKQLRLEFSDRAINEGSTAIISFSPYKVENGSNIKLSPEEFVVKIDNNTTDKKGNITLKATSTRDYVLCIMPKPGHKDGHYGCNVAVNSRTLRFVNGTESDNKGSFNNAVLDFGFTYEESVNELIKVFIFFPIWIILCWVVDIKFKNTHPTFSKVFFALSLIVVVYYIWREVGYTILALSIWGLAEATKFIINKKKKKKRSR